MAKPPPTRRTPGPLGIADRRPRIHIWPCPDGFQWSRGPTGPRSKPVVAPGYAVHSALDDPDLRDAYKTGAVFFLEAEANG